MNHDVSSPPMSSRLVSRTRTVLVLSALLVPLLVTGTARAQSFTIGAGGALFNDSGSAGRVSSFGTWGGFAYGEVQLDPASWLQLRLSRFGLPGTQAGAPNLRVDSASLTVSYLLREEWFDAGVFGGVGAYRMVPRDPEDGQTAVDVKENAFGLLGGLMTIVKVGARWDVRLEGTAQYIGTDVHHTPISLGASVSYRF